MKDYEILYILKYSEENVKVALETFKSIIVEGGGVVTACEDVGIRSLAYAIDGYNEGWYVVARFKAEPSVVKELDRNARINDNVLRHMIVRTSRD